MFFMNSMKLHVSKWLCGLIILCFSQSLIGQEKYKMPAVIPQSPDAAALGKYVESPVGFYNGVPQINIPLFNISDNGVNVPISISYAATGIKVEDMASSVGLGWSLSSGGSISRIVRGRPDELPNGFIDGQQLISKLQNNQFDPTTRAKVIKDINSGLLDGQADIFVLSLPGFSCKFFFEENGTIQTIPRSKVKIVPSPADGFGYRSWVVTTADGIKYELGATDGAELSGGIERTRTLNSCNPIFEESYSTWYLTKIIPLTGSPVTFEYDSYTMSYSVNAYQIRQDFLSAVLANGSGGGSCNTEQNLCTSTVANFAKKIKRIVFNSGIITFTAGADRLDLAGDKALSQVVVANNSGRLVKKYLFYQSYQNTSPSEVGPNGKRFFLDSLRIFDASVCIDATCTPNTQLYKFRYNAQALPPRNSFAQDYWGYYNGQLGNQHLVPEMLVQNPSTTQIMALTGAKRIPDEGFTKAGVLEAITYPTGGQQEFVYELNDVKTGIPEYYKTQQKTYYYSYPTPPPLDDFNGMFTINGCTLSKPKRVHFVATGVADPGNSSIPLDNKQQWRIYKWSNATNSYSDLVGSLGSLTELNMSDRVFYFEPGLYKVQMYRPNTSAPLYNATIDIDWKDDIDCNKIPAGGLRIKETRFYDGINSNGTMFTKYTYNKFDDNTTSSGALANFPQLHYIESIDKTSGDAISGQFIDKCIFFHRSSTPNQTMATTGMGTVGYSNITASKFNGTELLGKTEYTFQNPALIGDEIPSGFPFAPVNSMEWMRGNLIKKVDYRTDPVKGFEIVSSEESTYSTFEQQNYPGIKTGIDELILAAAGTSIVDVSAPKEQFFNTGTGFNYLSASKQIIYDQKTASRILEVAKDIYINAANYSVASSAERNSKGELLTTRYKYTIDYNTSVSSGSFANSIKGLVDKNVLSLPIEVYTITKDLQNSEWVTAGQLIEYNGLGLPVKVYQLNLAAPIALNSFMPSYINSGGVVIYDSRYELVATLIYDSKGNIQEQQLPNNISKKYAWGYNDEMPVAECTNCTEGWAYTSFEESTTGQWNAASVNRASGGVTGALSYDLSLGAVSTSGLSTSAKYIVSYWSKTGSVLITGASGALKVGRSVTIGGNTWTLYEQLVTGISTLTISGTGIIDELRLYPQMGQMLSMTFVPLIGISEKNDPTNKIEYYEYDLFGRLSIIRDQDRNIVKKIQYTYTGENQGDAIFPNTQQSRSFTRNNCAIGWVGGSATYTVPAGTYKSAISVAEANIPALIAVNANGQAYANSNASCLPTVNSINTSTTGFIITLTNTSTSAVYTYSIPVGSTSTQLGGIPIGTYTIQITQSGTTSVQTTFNGSTQTGTSFSYSNVNIAAPVTVSIAPAPVPCTFAFNAGYNSISNSFTSSNGVVSFYMAFYRNTTMTAGNTYFIGTINGGCRPSTTRSITFSSSGRTWTITIYANGQMHWYLMPGSATVNSNSVISCSTQTFNQ